METAIPKLETPPNRPEPKSPEPEISPPKYPHIDLPEPEPPKGPVPVKDLRLIYSQSWDADRAAKIALLFLGGTVLLRAWMAATLGLSDDEAWYWGLSQNLQLSYNVHPPFGIWLIRLSTALLGTSSLAVRLPAIVCSTLGAYWCFDLARRMGWVRGSLMSLALFVATPFWLLGGILVGPDQPLFAAWAGVMNLTYRMGMGYGRSVRTWLYLGIALGIAMLSKYTAFLAPIAMSLWFATTRHGRRAIFVRGYIPSRGVLLAATLGLIAFLPVLAWNAQAGWASLREQLFSRHTGSHPNALRWLQFALSQFALFGPAIFYGFTQLVKENIAPNSWDKKNQLNLRFLLIWSLVAGVPFFIQPVFAPFKIHWAFLAYVPIGIYFARLINHAPTKTLQHFVAANVALASIGFIALYFPVLGWAHLDFKRDFTNDFYGWDQLDRRLRDLPESWRELPLVASRYQIASQVAFATGSHSRVKILPYSSFSEDWGSDDTVPASFLFISDARFGDETSFPTHLCRTIDTIEAKRGDTLSKQIRLQLCTQR